MVSCGSLFSLLPWALAMCHVKAGYVQQPSSIADLTEKREKNMLETLYFITLCQLIYAVFPWWSYQFESYF